MPKSMTPLKKLLAKPESLRAQPIDAFKLARKKWLSGERINLAEMSDELGVGRATLSRWVGSKDQLLAEVLWSLYEPIFEQARNAATGSGAHYIAEVYRRTMQSILDARPLKEFVAQDSHYALGVMTASKIVQQRRLAACKALLQEQIDQGQLDLPLDLDTTAFVITRLNESFVHSEALVGKIPSIDKAVETILVLTGGAEAKSQP
ncbi:QsdR family transcriptional regulator [Halopseudomonas salegens]|uniref:QsdR family transcriptional regulator n=1 Tax=Halopseudomonas salegens TaxID=1434072 RepID=UPI0012FDA455|nr:QsdR family transcriptional regulator [Halopseudomonas salegens]